jgi:hypothetical protein
MPVEPAVLGGDHRVDQRLRQLGAVDVAGVDVAEGGENGAVARGDRDAGAAGARIEV